MDMQLDESTTAPSHAHLCVLHALQEAGAALCAPYPLPDTTTTAAPPVYSPSNRAQRLSIAGPTASPGPPKWFVPQKRKSHSEPFSLQRFPPECEHMHAEHAQLRDSRASEVLDSFTAYSIRRSASADSLSALRGRGRARFSQHLSEGAPAPAVALDVEDATIAEDAAALAVQAAVALLSQENAVNEAMLPSPSCAAASHAQRGKAPVCVGNSGGSISPYRSASRNHPGAQNSPPKQGGSLPLGQRYSPNLSAFSNQWHTGVVHRPGSSEFMSSSYVACSTCMSLRGTHSLIKMPQPTGVVPFAPRQPPCTHDSPVATGGARGPCSHTPTSSANSSIAAMSRALDQEDSACVPPHACTGTRQQPCMQEECEHCGDLSRSTQRTHGVESLAGGYTDLREAMAKLQDVVQLGTFGTHAVLPVHQFLAPVRVSLGFLALHLNLFCLSFSR